MQYEQPIFQVVESVLKAMRIKGVDINFSEIFFPIFQIYEIPPGKNEVSDNNYTLSNQ